MIDFLDLAGFMDQTDAYDHLVKTMPGIDHYCSSASWILAAHSAFHPQAEPHILALDGGYGCFLRLRNLSGARLLVPMEASWCLASPLIGVEPNALVATFRDHLRRTQMQWDAVLLSGFQRESAIFKEVVRTLGTAFRLFLGEQAIRCRASLAGGLAGYLSRRSRKFRANLRRMNRRTEQLDVLVETWAEPLEATVIEALYERVLAIETVSWKGQEGVGVDDGDMRAFYHRMFHWLGSRGRLRLLILQVDGEDVGYLSGGVFGRLFRGFQFSYRADLQTFGLGNFMQQRMIAHMVEEGAKVYDLGMDMPYKRRWAEQTMITESVWLCR